MTEPRQGLVERLFAEHRRTLQAFFYRRVRTKSDAADLAQEVYLRLLRVRDTDVIRNPEQYLYTVAYNLVKEHSVLERRRTQEVDADEPSVQNQLSELAAYDTAIDTARRAERLRAVLDQLPPKCRSSILLQYRDGLSYQEIGMRIGVSSHMVKKYVVQALAHCRRRIAELG